MDIDLYRVATTRCKVYKPGQIKEAVRRLFSLFGIKSENGRRIFTIFIQVLDRLGAAIDAN